MNNKEKIEIHLSGEIKKETENYTINKTFDNYVEVFKYLSKENIIIEKIENDSLLCKKNKDTFVLKIHILEKINIEGFINDISEYRKEVNKSYTALKEIGVELSEEELGKLKNNFNFITKK